MAEDGTNLLWGPGVHLEALIAASATFQTLVGVDAEDLGDPAGITAALAHVYCPAIAAADIQAARGF